MTIKKPTKKIAKRSTKKSTSRRNPIGSVALPSDPKVAYEMGHLFGLRDALTNYCGLTASKRQSKIEEIDYSISCYMDDLKRKLIR